MADLTSEAASDPILRVTLVDEIAERLRYRLMVGAIKPGTRILARELEREYRVSHIPIREALRRLEAQGVVTCGPHGQTIAARVGADELTEIWDARRLLETQVGRRAAGAFNPEQTAEVEAALAALRRETRDARSQAFLEAHRRFHWAILAPGGGEWLQRLLNQLWQGSDRYIQLFTRSGPFRRDYFMEQHTELSNASRTNDADALEVAVLKHITETEREVQAGYMRAWEERNADLTR